MAISGHTAGGMELHSTVSAVRQVIEIVRTRRIRIGPQALSGRSDATGYSNPNFTDCRRPQPLSGIRPVSWTPRSRCGIPPMSTRPWEFHQCHILTLALVSFQGVTSLAELFARHGPPEHLRSDNGPEFTARLVRRWLARVGVQTLFIQPGSPWENGYNESFNGKLRDEFLNGEIFYTLPEAVVLVEQWRRLYNTVRPHSAWGGLPPAPKTAKPSAWFLRMPQLLGPPMAQGLT